METNCRACGARLKPLFTSFFCPNNCDRPDLKARETVIPVTFTVPMVKATANIGYPAEGTVETTPKWPNGRLYCGHRCWAVHKMDAAANGITMCARSWSSAAGARAALSIYLTGNVLTVYGHPSQATYNWVLIQDP